MELKPANFSASRIGELIAGGSGKTRQSYILDLALQSIGIRDDFQTKEMLHGINNQLNAFQKVVLPMYTTAQWLDQYIPINDFCGASPDIICEGFPIDVKCQYYIDTFLEQCEKVPTKYFTQVNMQMIACGADRGVLVNYLTKPEIWGEDEWSEYPFELKERSKIFEFKKDEELCEKILIEVENAVPQKQYVIDLLLNAEVLDLVTFFKTQLNGSKYRKLKECSNIFNLSKVYRVENKFYYEKK